MGGSSLAPEVMQKTFGAAKGCPELLVLDSTDPAQIARTEAAVDVAHTLFIVSSKSGTTLETNLLFQYFLGRVKSAVGAALAPGHFIAITDPDSPLHRLAEDTRFRQVFFGVPGIGGRYSALSNFGLVPAALIGVDVGRLLDRTELMVHSCAASVPAEQNPAVVLGAILATLAGAGHDKVTFVASPRIAGLGAWLEQLIAESTGKNGKGLIPIVGEPLGRPDAYGTDRLFVYLRLDDEADPGQDIAVDELERAGQPIVRISIADVHDIGQEFFRWEFATAVAGSIIGINPFDQPDVEASKVATRRLTTGFERVGALPTETPIFERAGVRLFTDAKNFAALERGLGRDRSLAGYLRAHLNRIRPGDYFAMLAYLAKIEPYTRTRWGRCVLPYAIAHVSRRAWVSGPVSCTRPDKPTRADRIPASSSRSRATTPRTFRCPARAIRLASSRPLKHVATSRSSSSVTGGQSECIWAQTSAADCTRSRQRSRARCESTRRVTEGTARRADANGHGRAGTNGREHGTAPDARRPRMRRV